MATGRWAHGYRLAGLLEVIVLVRVVIVDVVVIVLVYVVNGVVGVL